MPPTTVRAVAILSARDLTKSLAFYTALGFEAKRYADGDGYAFLRWNGVEIHLSRSNTAAESRNPGAGVYFYLDTGSAAALEAAFRASGVHICSPLAARDWGMLEFALLDPDGNLLRFGELIQR